LRLRILDHDPVEPAFHDFLRGAGEAAPVELPEQPASERQPFKMLRLRTTTRRFTSHHRILDAK
jgi:hypothetical protein